MDAKSISQPAVPPKLRRVRVEVGRRERYEPIPFKDQSASILGVLFKEVLQQIQREMADKLAAAYRAGQKHPTAAEDARTRWKAGQEERFGCDYRDVNGVGVCRTHGSAQPRETRRRRAKAMDYIRKSIPDERKRSAMLSKYSRRKSQRYREEEAVALIVKCRSALLKLDPQPEHDTRVSLSGNELRETAVYTPDLVTHFIDELNGALYAAPIREGHWLKDEINSLLPAGMIARMNSLLDDETDDE